MKHWTTQAEQRLAEYLRERIAREEFQGEDAAELRDDLTRHIHEEAERSEGDTVGLMQLENLLGRLDAGYHPVAEKPLPARTPVAGGFWNWTFGVIFPVIVLILETLTSFCGSVFFSPVPTGWHVAWIAMVPFINVWLIRGAPRAGAGTQGAAAGFALVTAAFYGLLFLPMVHLSLLALVFFGVGILSLTPLLAALMSWRIGRVAKRETTDPRRFKTGWKSGALVALLVLAALEGPALWTRVNLSAATAGGPDGEAAITRLRTFHSERTLLKACYEGNRGTGRATDITGWLIQFSKHPGMFLFGNHVVTGSGSLLTRDVFFRVTGKAFNSMKPPGSARGSSLTGRGDPLEEFEFDDHLGGDDVAIRLKNLDLSDSRFDGHVDSVSRIGYGEWTMIFKNSSAQVKEARCQMKLPRDGRVSRLTLWVNGEPREAAFSTVSKVKAAYKAVAVVQRRDPVLVNMVGPDTVMVQCFPVPARGEMKIRLGITAPLADGRWELPHVVERNFGLAQGLGHAVWMQGDRSFSLTNATGKSGSNADGGGQSLSAEIGDERLMEPGTVISMDLPPAEPPVVWCEDRFAKPEERILIREPVQATRHAAEKLVVVIDGSLSMAAARDWMLRALAAQNSQRLMVVLADDTGRKVTLKELGEYRFSGGRDNEAALREGIRLARETGAPVVWLHGPQAVKVSRGEALLQLLERGTKLPVIHDVEAVSGPNRLAEAIYQTGCIHRGPSLAEPERDFTRFLGDLMQERTETAWNWKRRAIADDSSGQKVWDQLARLWATRAAEDPAMIPADAARTELAALYQLVTPVSGAVVLETQQQYAEHGLTPADGSATPAIPSVPEPSTGMLVILTTTLALLRRKRTA